MPIHHQHNHLRHLQQILCCHSASYRLISASTFTAQITHLKSVCGHKIRIHFSFIGQQLQRMSMKSNLNKNGWNDSMHIFFSPKLSLEGKNMLPHIVDTVTYHRDQNFLTVFKKPIVNVYDKISVRRDRKTVHVEGQTKQIQKRALTNNQKKRNISAEFEEELTRNFKETISQVGQLTRIQPRKALTNNSKVIQSRERQDNDDYYFYLGHGNNVELVQKILLRRVKWTKTSSSLYHFRWEQVRPKYPSNNTLHRQLINHLPNHQAISDKAGLTRNLRSYCAKNQIEMFRMIPVCFELNFGNPEVCELEIKKFVQFFWHCSEKLSGKYSQNDSSTNASEQKSNHLFESPKKLKKESPSKNVKNFRTHRKQTNAALNPETSRKKEEVKELHKTLLLKIRPYHNFIDMSTLKKDSTSISPIPLQIYGESNLWLLKPADLNRGRGIHLFRKVQDLGDLLQGQLSKNLKASFIIQKYIQKPMLIHSRKFDIRVYAMVTQNKELYFFKEGYIRTSSMKYDLNNSSQYAHLTNNAIQKYSKTYGQFQQGNILPLGFLVEHMGFDKGILYDEIKNRIKVSMKAGYSEMFKYTEKVQAQTLGSSPSASHMPSNKIKNFQIFGYDFMVDESGHIWIIEVNTNPCIELSCSWLKQIIPRMLDDAFKLTLDRIFPKGKVLKDPNNQYSVDGYKDEENMWEFMDIRSQSHLAESCPLL